MLRVARFACCVVLLMFVSAAGCDEDPPRPRDRSSTSATPTSPSASATVKTTDSDSATATGRTSEIANRTGYTITRDGTPIDATGLSAIGWDVHADIGEATWSDPALGEETLTWEVPDQRALVSFEVSFWGSVTGQNLAINPSMSSTVFTSVPQEATAHSTGGTKAETPTRVLRVTVPEQPVGATATVSINLGFPVPVLVTYTYVYE